MSNKVTVKDTNYCLENVSLPVVFTDHSGMNYRVSFNEDGLGILINKDAGSVAIIPKTSNQINVM